MEEVIHQLMILKHHQEIFSESYSLYPVAYE